jgi:hypothetical protein
VVCREIKGMRTRMYTHVHIHIYPRGPRGSNPAFFVSREALHDEEPDQIEGNYIVVGRPVPLWQPGCHICNNNLEQKK